VELPDLSQIVETHVPLEAYDMINCLNQLRRDVLPQIRRLQADGHLRWFSFLMHTADQLLEHENYDDSTPVIHIRLEPSPGLDIKRFIEQIQSPFVKPVPRPLGPISGPDVSLLAEGEWAHAWRIIGESSEWILCFLEAHPGDVTSSQLTQFLHYISNPMGLGKKFVYVPDCLPF